MMLEKKKLNWGILGPGKISKKFAQDVNLVDNAVLYAVGSRSEERAKKFAQAYHVEKAYGSYEDLLNDPDVDIIYIGTPHNSHKQYAIAAMNAGKHVLCEKPLGLNLDEVKEMIDASKSNQVFLMEALWSRFNPTIVEVLGKLKEGVIGEVNYVNVDFSVYRDFPVEGRMLNMDLAGGSLLDMGIYPVFLAYLVFGYPEQILAASRFHETGADMQTAAILKYKHGIANLLSGFSSQSDMVAKIHGTQGRILLNRRWHQADGYKIVNDQDETSFQLPIKGIGYTYEIEECIDCISRGLIESPKWSHQNSVDLIKIMDEIRKQVGLKYPSEG